MRGEFTKIVALTFFFVVLYFFTSFQSSIVGRVLIVIQPDMLIAIYSFLLAYILFNLHKYAVPLKPFSISIALYLILKVVAYAISRFSTFALVYPFVYSMDRYFLLFFIGFAVARVEIPFKVHRLVQPAVSALGLVIMGLFGYLILTNLPLDPDRTQKIGLGFLFFLLILAATSLANLSESGAARWLRNSRAFLLSFLVLAITYYIAIRPKIIERSGLVNFMEWMLVGIFLLKFSNDFRRSLAIEESEAVEVHRQRLSYKKDEMIERLEEARKLFLERGVKSPLIVSISRILVDAGWSEDRIAALISPIISYEDERLPKFVFGWEKKMIQNKNRKNRIKILKEIEEKMEGVGIGSEKL